MLKYTHFDFLTNKTLFFFEFPKDVIDVNTI